MIAFVLLGLFGSGIYFDNPSPKDQVLKSLDVNALGADNTFTLNGGFASYLTNRNKLLVIELKWQNDDKGVCRVNWVRFRLRSNADVFFPLRTPVKDEKGKTAQQRDFPFQAQPTLGSPVWTITEKTKGEHKAIGGRASFHTMGGQPNNGSQPVSFLSTMIRVASLQDHRPPALLAKYSGHSSEVFALAFANSGKTLVTGSADNNVRLWSILSNKNIGIFIGHTGPVNSVAASPDGKVIASASDDKSIILWEVFSGKQRAVLLGHTASVYVVAYSPDSMTIASASADKTIRLWDGATGRIIAALAVPDPELDFQGICSLVFSADGKVLASAGLLGQTIRLWDVKKAACVRAIYNPGASIVSLAFEPTGKLLMAADQNGTLRLMSPQTGETAICHQHDALLGLAFFSNDGAAIISGHPGGSIVFRDTVSGKISSFFQAHDRFVATAAHNADGKTLATCDWTNTVKVWDLSSGAFAKTLIKAKK